MAYKRIKQLSAETGYTVTQIALSFINSQYDFVGIPIIFSRKHEQIAEAINTRVDRGVTLLSGMGWYSKQEIKVVVVLAKKSESIDIFRLCKDIDPNAFISQSKVIGVYGEGFDKLKVK